MGTCAIKIGGNAPVAVAGLVGGVGRLPANATEFYAVTAGEKMQAGRGKVALASIRSRRRALPAGF
jgi:hypothetical protein